jgi:predicted anti-sigma-YlaC factor YlaD
MRRTVNSHTRLGTCRKAYVQVGGYETEQAKHGPLLLHALLLPVPVPCTSNAREPRDPAHVREPMSVPHRRARTGPRRGAQ